MGSLAFTQRCVVLLMMLTTIDAFSMLQATNHRDSEASKVGTKEDLLKCRATPLEREASNTRRTTTSSQGSKKDAHRVACSFLPEEFSPSPLLSNCHIQTICGVCLRNREQCRYIENEGLFGLSTIAGLIASTVTAESPVFETPDIVDFWDKRENVDTPDGDFYHVDFKFCDSKSLSATIGEERPMVVMLHGLQSSSNSSLSVDMATAFVDTGFDVACLNFRGCSGVPNNKVGGYHLGFTDDIKHFLSILSQNGENKPIFLSGFSLGASVVLNALGELGESAQSSFNVCGAAVCGAPFDQERNYKFLESPGFNSLVYMTFLLTSMKKRGLNQLEQFKGSKSIQSIDERKIREARSISDIEDAFVAPVYGFDSYIDYYQKTSCLKVLDFIAVPTFIINAADDPFFDPDLFPWEKSCDRSSNPIKMSRPDNGGHLGFMFHQAKNQVDSVDSFDKKSRNSNPASSWMPTELARFLQHVCITTVKTQQ